LEVVDPQLDQYPPENSDADATHLVHG
jgi:hypothetical protein